MNGDVERTLKCKEKKNKNKMLNIVALWNVNISYKHS